jgi:mRNA-degrading endonuclease toxin of MazEF toxin-antitoxin module
VRRGEIRWAEHPDWPRRSALLLTRDEAIDRLSEIFVVLATTNVRGLPTAERWIVRPVAEAWQEWQG